MKIIPFRITVDGQERIISNTNDMTAAYKELAKLIKGTDFGTDKLKALEKEQVDLLSTQVKLQQQQRETRKELKLSAQAATSAKGSLDKLSAELKLAEIRWSKMGEEAQKSLAGQKLRNNIKNLRKDVQGLKNDIGKKGLIQSIEQLDNSLGSVGLSNNILGSLVGGVASGGILGVAEAALGGLVEGVEHIRQITAEFRELRGETQALTGATGDLLDDYTVRLKAISETFGQDVDEILLSANALTDQLTGDFSKSLDIIETGFLANTNISGELLDNLREYPTFLQEAGFTAEQFLNIINQQADQGIFSDKGIDAIKEATIRLRELPTATQDGLAAIGLTADEITSRIDERGLAGAIELVSSKLNDFEDDSQEAGKAVAGIFGGPGEDAGISFLKSLQNINGSVEDLIDNSNSLTRRQLKQLELQRELATANNSLAKTWEALTDSSTDFFTELKIFSTETVANLLDNEGLLAAVFNNISAGALSATGALKELKENAELGSFRVFDEISEDAKDAAESVDGLDEANKNSAKSLEQLQEKQAEYKAQVIELALAQKDYSDELEKYREVTKEINDINAIFRDGVKASAAEAAGFAKGSIPALRQELKEMREELFGNSVGLTETEIEKALEDIIAKEEDLARLENRIDEIRNKLLREEIDVPESLPTLPINDVVSNAEGNESRILELTKDRIEAQLKAEEERLNKQKELEEAFVNEIVDNIFPALQQISDSIFETRRNNLERQTEDELQAVDEQSEMRLQSAGGDAEVIQQIERETAEEKERISRESAKKQKKQAIKQSLINTALAVGNALATVQPFIPAAIIAAAFAGVAGLAQTIAISNQKFAKGGVVNAPLGAILSGPSHTQGGVQVEAEGGEAFINKRSMASNEVMTLTGTPRQIASEINSFRGYGVRFASGAQKSFFQSGGIVENLSTPGSSGTTTVVRAVIEPSPEFNEALANSVSTAAEKGSEKGTSKGFEKAAMNSERNAISVNQSGF